MELFGEKGIHLKEPLAQGDFHQLVIHAIHIYN